MKYNLNSSLTDRARISEDAEALGRELAHGRHSPDLPLV